MVVIEFQSVPVFPQRVRKRKCREKFRATAEFNNSVMGVSQSSDTRPLTVYRSSPERQQISITGIVHVST